MKPICIFGDDAAEAIAAELAIPFVTAEQSLAFSLQLKLDAGILGLCSNGPEERNPVVVDWCSPAAVRRISQVSRRTEPLARALGLKANHRPKVVDATAGLGGDSVIINALGCSVVALERNPIVAALLGNGIKRSARENINLVTGDAVEWLNKQARASIEVVYLDPMFSKGDCRAQVKKPMQMMQKLVGSDEDIDALFAAAKHSASKRIVVKRGVKAPFISTLKPDFSVTGKAIRFDVYLCTS